MPYESTDARAVRCHAIDPNENLNFSLGFYFGSDILYDLENVYENERLASMDLEVVFASNTTNNSIKN